MTRRHHRPSVSACGRVLSVVWVLLWDTPTPLVVVSGLVVAVAVTVVFPLPRIERAGRVRPIGLIRLVVKLLADVIALERDHRQRWRSGSATRRGRRSSGCSCAAGPTSI